MPRALVLLVVAACVASVPMPAPRTVAERRAYRVEHARCRRVCPTDATGAAIRLAPGPSADPLADCCVDDVGIGHSSCAWNAALPSPPTRRRTAERFERLNCGGAGWRPCP